MVIAVALPARDHALATEAASVATARVRGHDLAIAMDRGLGIVAAGALVAVGADRVVARSARSVSIM
jgi:hypothetical protein